MIFVQTLLIPIFWVFEYPVPTWMSRRLCTKGGEKLKSIMAQANLNHIWYNSKLCSIMYVKYECWPSQATNFDFINQAHK